MRIGGGVRGMAHMGQYGGLDEGGGFACNGVALRDISWRTTQ